MSSPIRNRNKYLSLILIGTVCIGLLAANKIRNANVFLPTVRFGKSNQLAQVTGQLVLENGCLRIIESGLQTNYLVIWPSNSYILRKESNLNVWKIPRKKLATVNDTITLGGGSHENIESLLLSNMLSESMKQQIKESGCSGPFWLANI